MNLKSYDRGFYYTKVRDRMFQQTDTPYALWLVANPENRAGGCVNQDSPAQWKSGQKRNNLAPKSLFAIQGSTCFLDNGQRFPGPAQ